MEKFWILILVSFFARNSLDKAESVQLEELPLQTFDELFVDEWWDKDEAEDLKTLTPTNFGQNEANSTDQNPLTESDHSDNANSNENVVENERKREIIDKFHAIKEELKQKGKFPRKERAQIEQKIAEHLKVSRKKIYKWKKEFGLSPKVSYEIEERKHLVDKFDQMKAELTRGGFKNSYNHDLDKTVANELGLSITTIYAWKRELGQTAQHKQPHSKQKELMKHYYEIKGQKPKISDEEIAKMLKIGTNTLYRWKKQFERQQFHPNSVDGHSVEENAAANVQEIGNSSNSGSI